MSANKRNRNEILDDIIKILEENRDNPLNVENLNDAMFLFDAGELEVLVSVLDDPSKKEDSLV